MMTTDEHKIEVADQFARPVSAPQISIVIPCLNEEEAIGGVVRRAVAALETMNIPGEVLVVDNGSTDATVPEALRAGARIVFEPQRGYGNAYKRGFSEALGQYLIMIDGDDTYPIEALPEFIALLESGCDLVNGDRFAGGMSPGAMTWSHRYLGTPLLSWMLRRTTGLKLADSQCGMRALRASAVRGLDLRASGMEFASEMLVKAARARLRIGQVPVSLSPRLGESKLQTLPDGWRHLRYLLVASPDYLFSLPGLLLFAIGCLVLGLQVRAPDGVTILGGHWRPEYASIILAAAGVQVMWSGVLVKLYYTATGLVEEDRLIRWFLRVFSLERALISSLLVLGLGGILEIAVALQQFDLFAPGVALRAAAAFAVLIGLQSFFSSFIAYVISSEYTRPIRAEYKPARPALRVVEGALTES